MGVVERGPRRLDFSLNSIRQEQLLGFFISWGEVS